jgi:hypothetical protein
MGMQLRLPRSLRGHWRRCLSLVGSRICWMSEPVPVLFDRTYGMSFPPSPTQFAVPSVALTPAVIPKGGMSEVSTEPEEAEEETPAEEEFAEEAASGEEAVEEKPVPEVAAGAAEVIVMKVLGRSLPPPPPWCL